MLDADFAHIVNELDHVNTKIRLIIVAEYNLAMHRLNPVPYKQYQKKWYDKYGKKYHRIYWLKRKK